jgi:hypothetical protein
MGACAQTGATHPADHLPLTDGIAWFDIKLGEVAVERAAKGTAVLNLDGQPITSGIATAHHTTGQGSHDWGAFWRCKIAAGVHDPRAQNRVEPPAKIAGGHGRTNQGEQQAPIAVATNR